MMGAGNAGEAIGMEAVRRIAGPVTDALFDLPAIDFPTEHAGVYSLGTGDYVSEGDWEDFWSAYPAWYWKAWMLLANGGPSDDVDHGTADEAVAALTIDELDEALDRCDLDYV